MPVRKKPAYAIKKQSQAYLATLNFQMNPENVKNLEKKLKEEKKILRYLILAKKASRKIKPARRESAAVKSTPRPKVELKEIEKKLEEILGQ